MAIANIYQLLMSIQFTLAMLVCWLFAAVNSVFFLNNDK